MNRQKKRAYKAVEIAAAGNGFAVMLDGKAARLRSAPLQLPNRALAEAVAEEWREQGKQLDPERMRLTGLVASALTRVPAERGAVIEHILGYGRNELLCYRATEPADLAVRQKAQWNPMLEWIHTKHNVRLVADSGISFIGQPVDALVRMQEIVSDLDDFELAALDAAAALTTSFVVALALIEQHISAEEAFAISHLDELYQAEKWGRDAEADCRRVRIVAELKAVERFVSLLGD